MTKKEQLLAEYKKERKRIQSNISRLKKKGFDVSSKDILPSIPKKITEGSIRRLQKMSPKVIKSKVEVLQTEIIFEDIKKDASKKPKQTSTPKRERVKATADNFYRDVVSGFLSELVAYPVEIAKPLESGIKRMIKKGGIVKTAEALLNIPTTFHDMIRIYKNYEDAIENFFGAMANYLDLSQGERENLQDVIEGAYNEY